MDRVCSADGHDLRFHEYAFSVIRYDMYWVKPLARHRLSLLANGCPAIQSATGTRAEHAHCGQSTPLLRTRRHIVRSQAPHSAARRVYSVHTVLLICM